MRRDTGGNYRIFTVRGESTVALDGLTISNGIAPSDNGGNGGGIDNYGMLTVTHYTLTHNSAEIGDGLYIAGGTVYRDAATVAVIFHNFAPISDNDIFGPYMVI